MPIRVQWNKEVGGLTVDIRIATQAMTAGEDTRTECNEGEMGMSRGRLINNSSNGGRVVEMVAHSYLWATTATLVAACHLWSTR